MTSKISRNLECDGTRIVHDQVTLLLVRDGISAILRGFSTPLKHNQDFEQYSVIQQSSVETQMHTVHEFYH